jgi:signal transduction histidine kinase
MRPRPTLRRKLLGWLLGYLALVTLVVFAAANYVHEHAEHGVWRAMLNSELDRVSSHLRQQPDYLWQDSDTMHLFRGDARGQGLPASLQALHPGLHDGPLLEGRSSAVMVRQTDDLGRLVMVMDITDFAEMESLTTRLAILAGAALVLVTLLMAWVGMTRLVRPLSSLAQSIAGLREGQIGQRVDVDRRGSAELEVIAAAVNDYLERNQRFVERERAFISTTSHELRTPMAVISGAAELGMDQTGVPERVRTQLQRIRNVAGGVEQLISLLLVLARDPNRLAALGEQIALAELIAEGVCDHQHLARGKELQVSYRINADVQIFAPPAVVQAAIGNLLRNAIENSDRGQIVVSLQAPALVRISDSGHGMSPQEISQLYARLARGQEQGHGGIGLALIGRLCEHLGWQLTLKPREGGGTVAELDMAASLIPDEASGH